MFSLFTGKFCPIHIPLYLYYRLKDINVDVPHGEFESKDFFKSKIVYYGLSMTIFVKARSEL